MAVKKYADQGLSLVELSTKFADGVDARCPPEFQLLDPSKMQTDFCCPSCGYDWTGSPKPTEKEKDLD